MRPKIVFLVMSAQQSDELVGQLVDALAPHPVVVHHDFFKRNSFKLDRKRAHLVPDPLETGWGTWGFCEAILHGMQHCCENFDFDYLQLLSPTCLPIRPIAEFEAHVSDTRFDVHGDLIELLEDRDAWMTYAWRAFLPHRSLRQRIANRMVTQYFGDHPRRAQLASLVVMASAEEGGSRLAQLRRRAAVAVTECLTSTLAPGAVYSAEFRPFVGSTWFGARRVVVEHLLLRSREERLREFFSSLTNVDEHFLPSLIGNSSFTVGRSNHAVSKFDLYGHPVPIDAAVFSVFRDSQKFFARKFPADPQALVRKLALARARARIPSGVCEAVASPGS